MCLCWSLNFAEVITLVRLKVLPTISENRSDTFSKLYHVEYSFGGWNTIDTRKQELVTQTKMHITVSLLCP